MLEFAEWYHTISAVLASDERVKRLDWQDMIDRQAATHLYTPRESPRKFHIISALTVTSINWKNPELGLKGHDWMTGCIFMQPLDLHENLDSFLLWSTGKRTTRIKRFKRNGISIDQTARLRTYAGVLIPTHQKEAVSSWSILNRIIIKEVKSHTQTHFALSTEDTSLVVSMLTIVAPHQVISLCRCVICSLCVCV